MSTTSTIFFEGHVSHYTAAVCSVHRDRCPRPVSTVLMVWKVGEYATIRWLCDHHYVRFLHLASRTRQIKEGRT